MELMVTIGIAAILLGIGIPSMTQFLRNSRMTSAANDLLVAIHTARSQAINLRTPVMMCFSADPTAAVPACNGNGTQGWVVFTDDRNPAVTEASDNNGTPDAGEPVLLRHTALADGINLKSLPAGNKGYVAFNAAGFSRRIASVGDSIAGVVMCDPRGNVATAGSQSAARGLIVSQMGRPRVTRSVSEISSHASLNGCS